VPILIAVIVFGLVVLIHELGHFWAARRCGILVEEFAIGMGPKLFGIQRGETLYTIRLLPLGGFCRMYGDEADSLSNSENSEDEDGEPEEDIAARQERRERLKGRAFNSKSIPQRMAVMVAGSFMNFVLAFVLFSILVSITGFSTTTVRYIAPNSPAEASGFMTGDRIISINGSRILLFDDLRFEISMGYGRPADIGFIRDGRQYNVTVVPTLSGGSYRIGVTPEFRTGLFTDPPEGFERAGIVDVVSVGFLRIGHFIRTVVISIVRAITTQVNPGFAGPIGIVDMIGGQYQQVMDTAAEVQAPMSAVILTIVLNMVQFSALLSANLAVLNLLPLPALDGGRLIFLTLEAIRRKPISPEREGMVHFVGFVLLMVLAVFIAYQDILNLL